MSNSTGLVSIGVMGCADIARKNIRALQLLHRENKTVRLGAIASRSLGMYVYNV